MKLRIKEATFNGTIFFTVQRKFIWWWFNPYNIDGYTTGVFDTLKEAQDALDAYKSKEVLIRYHS